MMLHPSYHYIRVCSTLYINMHMRLTFCRIHMHKFESVQEIMHKSIRETKCFQVIHKWGLKHCYTVNSITNM
jgi:hypothetical protein